jgi:hypothetical protein
LICSVSSSPAASHCTRIATDIGPRLGMRVRSSCRAQERSGSQSDGMFHGVPPYSIQSALTIRECTVFEGQNVCRRLRIDTLGQMLRESAFSCSFWPWAGRRYARRLPFSPERDPQRMNSLPRMAGTMPAAAGSLIRSPANDEMMGAIPSRKRPIAGAFLIRCSISGFGINVMTRPPK